MKNFPCYYYEHCRACLRTKLLWTEKVSAVKQNTLVLQGRCRQAQELGLWLNYWCGHCSEVEACATLYATLYTHIPLMFTTIFNSTRKFGNVMSTKFVTSNNLSFIYLSHWLKNTKLSSSVTTVYFWRKIGRTVLIFVIINVNTLRFTDTSWMMILNYKIILNPSLVKFRKVQLCRCSNKWYI